MGKCERFAGRTPRGLAGTNELGVIGGAGEVGGWLIGAAGQDGAIKIGPSDIGASEAAPGEIESGEACAPEVDAGPEAIAKVSRWIESGY
jgi:hypothetical protein